MTDSIYKPIRTVKMENNINVLIGKISFLTHHRIPGMIFLSLYLCACPSISTAVSIWPTEIKFDDESGYSDDALTLKSDNDHYVTVPERIYYGSNETSVAYIEGQTNRKIKVKFDSNTDNTNFLVKATVLYGDAIGAVCETFVADCELDENRWITVSLTGSIPASVGIKTFTWKWEATALPMSSPYCPVACNPVYTDLLIILCSLYPRHLWKSHGLVC